MPSVKLMNVTKRYGEIVAVDNVNLQIEDKEYLCIIGPSGCGKTTLIKCISGIIEPTEGEIYIDGKLMNNVPINERGVGYVFQEIALFPHMNVYENVSYGPMVKGSDTSKIISLVREILNLMALSDRIRDQPSVLSGGAQQKTAVARALASGSILLLFDEPLGSLDAKVRAMLRHELRKMIKDLGLTAIHVTHDQQEAMAIADRIVIMKTGKIIEVGTPLELYLRPKALFTANFLGEANFIAGKIVEKTCNGVRVETNSGILKSSQRVGFDGDKVVVAIRPEFVTIKKNAKARRTEGLWRGRIKSKVFMGSIIHFTVETESGDRIISKCPFYLDMNKWDLNDQVFLEFPPDYVLLYPYPRDGIEKEVSIE
jgi:ABC-type Fe3+/spermidine/putrescine transport system ATPase subunit